MNTIVLEGGLGNRMRVAAAAYVMAQQTALPFRVLWTRQWGMHCRFDDLFLPLASPTPEDATPSAGDTEAHPDFVLRDARGMERFLFARPTAANLHLPRLAQRLLYRHIILGPQIYYLLQDGFDFRSWFLQNDCLMTAYRDFCAWPPTLLARLFRPRPEILREVDARCTAFSSRTIGLHIRRTDSQQSISCSPDELFFEAVDSELSQHPDLHVYLATDDQPTKERFRQRYGDTRIQTASSVATRDNVEGLREAFIEMLLLSRTSHIYGSAGSTFSEMAARYTSVPLTILQKPSEG